jgi:hypothetical protein
MDRVYEGATPEAGYRAGLRGLVPTS